MPRSYSADRRKRVLDEISQGRSAGEAARRFQVSPPTAARWQRQWYRRGQYQARPRGRRPNHGSKLEPYMDWIRRTLARQPDMTLKTLRAQLADHHGLRVGQATLSRVLRHYGLTFKKRQLMPKSRPVRT